MGLRAFITGLAGTSLTDGEHALLRALCPWGLILFRRNISHPGQVVDLIKKFRAAVGRPEAPVLIDQEGGRVARLTLPHWPAYPPGAVYGQLYERDPELGLRAARTGARLIAADLAALGITVNCLPVADVPVDEADQVIGDRAYGDTPEQVAALGRAVAEGLMAGGVLPVVKHIPGHGRAMADSHVALPVVEARREILDRTDFAAFRLLADLPMAMTAHVVFTAIDPLLPATTSAVIIGEVIRGAIGFDGLLMSDDISMGALSGSLAERTRLAIAAGCDMVLHCNGDLAEMREVAGAAPLLAGKAAERAARALAMIRPAAPCDTAALRAEFDAMLAGAPPAVQGPAAQRTIPS